MKNELKRVQLFMLGIIVLSLVFISGCGSKAGTTGSNSGSSGNSGSDSPSLASGFEEKELLASYEDSYVPAFIEKSGNTWYAMQQEYSGDGDYNLVTAQSPDDLRFGVGKGDIGRGAIWDISADGDYLAWGERNNDQVTINLYNSKTDEAARIVVLPEDRDNNKLQQCKVYVKDGRVFYCNTDYDKKLLQIMAYDIEKGESSVLVEEGLAYDPGGFGCFAMRDNYLLFESYSMDGLPFLAIYDTKMDDLRKVELPECVGAIWDADINGDTIALYYYDHTEGNNAWNQADNIAVFERGEKDIVPIFSFPTSDTGASWYAYNDDIELFGDNVIWIYQQNVTGDILDHYHMTVYNYKTHDYIEEPATFSFMTDGEDLYWLSWDGNINKVDIYKAK